MRRSANKRAVVKCEVAECAVRGEGVRVWAEGAAGENMRECVFALVLCVECAVRGEKVCVHL